MRISEVDNFNDFATLKDTWNNLLQRSSHTVFSTWEWLSTWWRHFGNGRRLLILLAEEDNRLIGIAPLMFSVHSMFGLRKGTIEFLGSGPVIAGARFVNYSDFIIENKHEKCLPLFFDYLDNLQEKWSDVELTNIPGKQDSLSRLNQVTNNIKPVYPSLHIPLPATSDALLKSLKHKDKKELGRYSRRLKKSGLKNELVDCSKIQLTSNGMKMLFALNQKRWNAKGLPGAFTDPNLCSFYLDIAECFSQKGWLGLYCLNLSGKTVGVLYGFRYMGKYYAYKTGMDPAYRHFNVGNLLFLNVMEECIRDGLTEFDFMWGTEAYKMQWKTSKRWNYEAIVPKKRPFGGFKYLLYNWYWYQGKRLEYFQRRLLKRSQ
ncbi:MAG: GNAT family N-acetyltransferase [Candidatus Bathyarchaeia archaeon]